MALAVQGAGKSLPTLLSRIFFNAAGACSMVSLSISLTPPSHAPQHLTRWLFVFSWSV